MEEIYPKDHYNDEIFSRVVRAGKRTYFFDVKSTVKDDLYITITESKRLLDAQTGSYTYEKHKLFLYREDFERFANGLSDVIEFIETGEEPLLRSDDFSEEHQVNETIEEVSIKSGLEN